MTQRDDCEPVGGLGIAAAKGGSVNSRRLGQMCVGTNKEESWAGKADALILAVVVTLSLAKF